MLALSVVELSFLNHIHSLVFLQMSTQKTTFVYYLISSKPCLKKAHRLDKIGTTTHGTFGKSSCSDLGRVPCAICIAIRGGFNNEMIQRVDSITVSFIKE